MALLSAFLMAVMALWSKTPAAEAQVYAYEEDFDRGYPGAGPYGYYHNICNFECPDVWSPVCATDGYSYPSGCHLFVASCWKQILGQKSIRFWYRGTCLLEGSTNYDPQPGLKKREEEERQRKIDAGEWVPTIPPDDAIYINGQPYLPPFNPAPTPAPAGPPVDDSAGAVSVAEAEREGEGGGSDAREEGTDVGEEEDDAADVLVEASTTSGFAPEETPIESRRRRRRRSLLHLLDQASSRRPRHLRRRHRHHHRRHLRVDDECRWACPLTPQPLCGSDGRTHFNECHFLRHKCRVDAAVARKSTESVVVEDAVVVDEAVNSTMKNAVVAVPDELVIRHAGRCGRFVDAADARVRECVSKCGSRSADEEIRPVCASDGKTYPNFCFYQQAKCLAYLNEQTDINFFKMGFCD